MAHTKHVRPALSLTLIGWITAVVPASTQHFQEMEGSFTDPGNAK
jgi:hypothetical protein